MRENFLSANNLVRVIYGFVLPDLQTDFFPSENNASKTQPFSPALEHKSGGRREIAAPRR